MMLFIVLACLVSVALADHGKKTKEPKNPICSKELSVKPTDCCPSMPSFKQYFTECAAQCNQTSTDPSVTSAPKRGKGRHGNKQFYKCVMPCVIQKAGILGTDGNISSDLLTQQLLKGASSEWTSIVPNVVSSCYANGSYHIESQNLTNNLFTATAKAAQHKGRFDKLKNSKSSSDKATNRLNGMIMRCTFKNLFLACPTPVDSSDCKDLTEKMTKCPCEHEGRRAEKKGKKEKKGKGKGQQTEAPVETEM